MKNMKTKEHSQTVVLAPASNTSVRVKQELAAMERAYKKISRSKEATQTFLYNAGIVTKTGKLRKKYR